jgi:pimeloyl-ACP methyl ester carboxylesterase
LKISEVRVGVDRGSAHLAGILALPQGAVGLVAFAHGSGSSRHSPRNRFVANVLNEGRFATLLVDLLTESEEAHDERTASMRFDVPLLSRRLWESTERVILEHSLGKLPIGFFGASTGAAAALVAASERRDSVFAVVSRGGRPDLAGDALSNVRAPTLLIVGGADQVVLDLNRRAMELIRPPASLTVIPGATHLFEEPGALSRVADLAREWFERHLPPARKEIA